MNLVTAAVRVFDPRPVAFSRTTALSEPLLLTFDPSIPDGESVTLRLLESSDTGDLGDGVTKIAQPAFGGVAEANAQMRVLATDVETETTQIVGQGVVNSDESNVQSDGLGTWEITVEPLADGVYDIVAQVEDRAGNIATMSAPLRVEIDSEVFVPAPGPVSVSTARLDLVASDDTGRHDADDVTRVAAPLLSATVYDALGDVPLAEDSFIYRIFDRPTEGGEVLIYDSFAVLDGYTDRSRLFTTADGEFGDSILPTLTDGSHTLKLEVEDRSGNISQGLLPNLVIDTQGYLGTGRLHPDRDTGVPGFADTLIDRITSDNVPLFFGVAEADNLVIVRIDGVRAGTGTAVPANGNDAFQPPEPPNAPVQGNWQVLTNTVLDEGEHTVIFTFEDLAGNQATTEPTRITIDSEGPRSQQRYVWRYRPRRRGNSGREYHQLV